MPLTERQFLVALTLTENVSMSIYIIYETKNIITNQFYIGYHSCKSLEFDGYFGSGIILQRAINKYGKNNFTRKTLEIVIDNVVLSSKEICEIIYPRETFWIKKYLEIYGKDMLYNINVERSFGGDMSDFIDYKKAWETKRNGENYKKYCLSLKERNNRAIENGTHNFCLDSHPAKIAAREGTHQWQTKEHSLKSKLLAKERLENGEHQNIIEWCCVKCKISGVGLGNFNKYHIHRNCLESKKYIKSQEPKSIPLNEIQWECEYCGKIGFHPGNHTRWHGNNCKHKK